MSSSQKAISFSVLALVAILSIWYFIPKNTTLPSGMPVSDSAKKACEKLLGAEKASCEIRVTESDILTDKIKTATEGLNIESCNNVASGAQASCKDIIYFEKAMKSKDIKECKNIQDQKKQDVCKKNLAVNSAK